jgi:hypothetical protein
MKVRLTVGDVVCLATDLLETAEGNFVLYDDPARGGDGTYFSPDAEEDHCWVKDHGRAAVMQADELRNALEDCDNSHLFRGRFVARRVNFEVES